ncbi:MAG: flp [Rhodospirillaceae bacterium]|nr:MAG: flp [Rhodospirillaceae bacterium]
MNAMGKSVLSGTDYDELRRFDLFSNFANDELHRLLRGTVHRTYRRGKVLFVQGDRLEWFFLVLNGRVKLVQRAENGDEGIVDIFGAGQSFGEAAVLTARPFPVGAEVMTDCRLIQVAAWPSISLEWPSRGGGAAGTPG